VDYLNRTLARHLLFTSLDFNSTTASRIIDSAVPGPSTSAEFFRGRKRRLPAREK